MGSSFKDLEVWRASMDYVKTIYRLTSSFPDNEKFGLVPQIQRAAVSIPSNISEGCGRQSKKEFIHFLYTARGSLMETITQFELAYEFDYIDKENYEALSEKAKKTHMMLNGLIRALKK